MDRTKDVFLDHKNFPSHSQFNYNVLIYPLWDKNGEKEGKLMIWLMS